MADQRAAHGIGEGEEEDEAEDEFFGPKPRLDLHDERELQMIVQIARLPPACATMLAASRVGALRLRRSSLDEVEEIACRARLRPVACLRLLLAVRVNLHRLPVHLDPIVTRLLHSNQAPPGGALCEDTRFSDVPTPRLGLACAVRGGRLYG